MHARSTRIARLQLLSGYSRWMAASGVLLLGATLALNGLNAVFHFVLARVLEPAEYSLLASLLVVVLIVTVPALAVQAAVAREVASALAAGDAAAAGATVRAAFRGLARVGGAALVLVAVIAYPVSLVLKIEHPWPVLATVAAVVAGLAVPPAWGALQGAQRFVALAAAQLAWAALRLTLAVGFGVAGAGAAGAMAGVAIGTAVAALLSLVPLAPMIRTGGRARARPLLVSRYVGGAGTGFAVFSALTALDVLVARLAFAPSLAGAYAAASVGARTLLLVATAVTTVLFPRVATLGDPLRERRHLLAGLAAVAVVCALALPFMFAIPERLVHLAFGPGYDAAAHWLGPLGVAMLLYGLVNVFLLHFLSLGQTLYVGVLAGLIGVQAILFAVFHGRPGELVGVQLACSALALATAELLDRRSRT